MHGGRRLELDGIRGIAVLLVLLCHAGFAPFSSTGGVLGVTMFFVLSGYLITGLLQREVEESGRLRLGRFYGRRFWRLTPALAVLVLVCAWIRGLEGQADLLGTLAALGYFSDYVQALGHSVMLEHTWSLGVEEQFYLLWPLGLLVLLKLRHRVRPWLVVAGLAVVGIVWREVVFQHDYVYAYRAFDTNAFALLAGCSLALSKRRLPVWCATVGMLGIGWLVLGQYNGWSAWVPGAGAVCGVLLIGGSASSRWLTPGPLRWTGRVSYSLYLWHAVIFPGLGMLTLSPTMKLPVIGLAFVAASASYYLVERPCLAYRDRRQEMRSRTPHVTSDVVAAMTVVEPPPPRLAYTST